MNKLHDIYLSVQGNHFTKCSHHEYNIVYTNEELIDSLLYISLNIISNGSDARVVVYKDYIEYCVPKLIELMDCLGLTGFCVERGIADTRDILVAGESVMLRVFPTDTTLLSVEEVGYCPSHGYTGVKLQIEDNHED